MGKKSEQRRQKSLQRKAARRKEKKQAVRSIVPGSPRALLGKASTWPVHECLLSKDWQKPGEIVQVLVARRSPAGQLAAGVFLVDLGCLGVKNAFGRLFDSPEEYRQLRRQIMEPQEMQAADLNLVAKIVHEAIAYARKLGFSPHRDSREAMPFLEGADPSACDVPVPLGDGTGKPFYVSGPHDNVRRIMAQLTKAVGPRGFGYLAHIGMDEDIEVIDLDLDDE